MRRPVICVAFLLAALLTPSLQQCNYVIQMKGPVYDIGFVENAVDYYLSHNERTCVHHCAEEEEGAGGGRRRARGCRDNIAAPCTNWRLDAPSIGATSMAE